MSSPLGSSSPELTLGPQCFSSLAIRHCFARPIRLVRCESTSSGGWSDEANPLAAQVPLGMDGNYESAF